MPASCPDGNETGFTLFELLITVAILVTVLVLVFGNLVSAKRAGNEGSAIASLRQIHHAQTGLNAQDIDGDGINRYANSLLLLGSYDLIDDSVAKGTKSGYFFTMESGTLGHYVCRGDPAEFKITGERYFFLDQSGIVRFDTDGPANASSLAVE